MKRFLSITLIAMMAIVAMNARDTYSRNAQDLPATAQKTLTGNFKAGVSVIKIDKGLRGISEYDVVLTDGTEITFDREGFWTDVEVAMGKKVPDSLIPKAILDYIKNNNQGKKIIGIEKDRNTYNVELENGLQLKFDRAGKFLRYDD